MPTSKTFHYSIFQPHIIRKLQLFNPTLVDFRNKPSRLNLIIHYLSIVLVLRFVFDMGDNNNNVNLPPGFRFCPTDEELVVHFLQRKASLLPYHPDIIPDLDLYPYDPWDLDGKAMVEGKKWYYYSRRTQNRITVNGYWKALGCDEQIISSSSNKRVGIKKYYVFHIGEAPEGVKTNWIMQEFRLSDHSATSSSSTSSGTSGRSKRRSHSKIDFSKWVICRVVEHSCDDDDDDDGGTELSCLDEVFLSLDDFDDISFPN